MCPKKGKYKKMSNEKKFASVAIPMLLYKKVKKRIKGTEFSSVSDYVTYVLKEVLTEEESPEEEIFSEKEEKQIKSRLKALGYLN